jgi:fructokinase
MKILGVGEALIDMICVDKGKSLSEGNNFLKKTGGAPTNVAAAIASLGGQAELAARLAPILLGSSWLRKCSSWCFNKSMLQDPRFFTTFAFVSLMEDGKGTFISTGSGRRIDEG